MIMAKWIDIQHTRDILLLGALTLFTLVHCGIRVIQTTRNVGHDGVYSSFREIDKVLNISRVSCLVGCIHTEGCHSVYYQPTLSLCHMVSRPHHYEVDEEIRDGYQHITITKNTTCPTEKSYTLVTSISMCYKHYSSMLYALNYTECLIKCWDDGGELVKMDSLQRRQEIQTLQDSVRIQGSRKVSSTRWVFADGTSMQYLPWGVDEPALRPLELTIAQNKNGRLRDCRREDDKWGCVCEV